jgi:hypothetical protein
MVGQDLSAIWRLLNSTTNLIRDSSIYDTTKVSKPGEQQDASDFQLVGFTLGTNLTVAALDLTT